MLYAFGNLCEDDCFEFSFMICLFCGVGSFVPYDQFIVGREDFMEDFVSRRDGHCSRVCSLLAESS
jgi:hypothetical protein